MRKIYCFYLFLPFILISNAFSQEYVKGNSVAEIEIGKPMPKLEQKRIAFQRKQFDENGVEFVRTRVKVAVSLVDVEVYEDLVWRLEVLRPGLFTIDRAQVGSSVKALLRRNLSILPQIGPGPSLVLVPETPCGISYITDLNFKGREYENLTRETVLKIARNSKVTKIMVVGCSK